MSRCIKREALITIFFSKKRSVTRRQYCDPIGMVDKGTKKSQMEYIMGYKRMASQLAPLKITESQ